MSAAWINKINESDSRLHKEGIIGLAFGTAKIGDQVTHRLLQHLRTCYNPFVTFGVRTVPTTEGIVEAENPWDEYAIMLDKLALRQLSGHAARDTIIAMSLRFDSDEWNVFCRPVILKDIRAGISEKTINKMVKGTEYEIPTFGCQLATSMDGRPEMSGTKRLEPKLDGVRTLMMVVPIGDSALVTCYSRNGKIYENFTHIEDQITDNISKLIALGGPVMAEGFVLDGEIIGKSFNELMTQARRKTDQKATDSIFTIFDIVPLIDFRRGWWNLQQDRRIEILERLRPVIDTMPNVDLLSHILVDLDTAAGRDQFDRYCHDKVAEGYEGVMIKDMGAPYECRRSTFWLKYKPVLTVDLKIIDVEEGTGKNVGRLGALVCHGTDHGKTISVNCGSGFSDQQRDDIWLNRNMVIGQTAEILCDVISVNADGTHSLRFPRFVRFRDDK